MIDVLDTIREFLIQRPSVFALTGKERIWAGRVYPPKSYKPENGSGIAFQVRGGDPTYEDDHYFVSVQLKCYGLSEVAANQLYRALYTDLQPEKAASRAVRHVEFETLGTTLEEPDSEWRYVLVNVNFMVRDLEGEAI